MRCLRAGAAQAVIARKLERYGLASAGSGQPVSTRSRRRVESGSLSGREGMEGLVLLVARRRSHGLRRGKDGAEVGREPWRFVLTLAVIAIAHVQPERDIRTPTGGYTSTPASTTAATPAGHRLGVHPGCVFRLYRRPL